MSEDLFDRFFNFELLGCEEISEDDITQEGKFSKEDVVNIVLYHLFNKKDWKLIRRIK